MSSIEVKSFSNADEINTDFNNARIDAVNVGGQRVLQLTLQPGWKWSECIKPMIGTDTCQKNHVGVCVNGKLLPKLLSTCDFAAKCMMVSIFSVSKT